MRLHRSAVALGAACVLVALTSGPAAQQQTTTLPYGLALDGEAARDLVKAIQAGAPYVPGELIVKFRDGYGDTARARALATIRGGVSGARTRWIGDAILLGTPGEPDAVLAARLLERQPEIEWAQPNYIRRRRLTPNDAQYPLQWHFDAIDLPAAWDINPGGSSSVTVAVIDSGLTTVTQTFSFRRWSGSGFETISVPFAANPDIPASRVVSARDFVFWNGPVLDMDGHGTHVAGTVAQETNNSIGVAGVSFRARLMPLKVCLSYWDVLFLQGELDIPGAVDPDDIGCPDSAMAAALRFAADNGAQVINVSLGAPGEAPILRQALEYAVQRGSFVAMPSGNGFEEGNQAEFPAAYAAQIDGAVEVAAVGRSQRRAYYSTTGPHVELAAPGGDPFDGGSSGFIYQVAPRFSDFDPSVARPRFDDYIVVGAIVTSSAAPHAAGVAALLYAQGITSPAAIEAALKLTATDLGTTGRDNDFGHGLINARTALRGMGLVR
jgi:serine protease